MKSWGVASGCVRDACYRSPNSSVSVAAPRPPPRGALGGDRVGCARERRRARLDSPRNGTPGLRREEPPGNDPRLDGSLDSRKYTDWMRMRTLDDSEG